MPALPHIVLMLADDLGWGDPGYSGGTAHTPHLDAMASAPGVLRADRFYSAAPVCSPTRASVQTGRNPRRDCIFGVEVHSLPTAEFTIGKVAKAAGYRTAHFGKWHLGSLDADKVPGQVPTDVRDGMDGPLAVVTPRMMGYDEFLSTPGCGSATNPNCGCVDESMASCVTGHYGHSTDSGRTRGLMVIPCGQYFRQRANESRPAPWAGRSPDDDADFLFGAFAAFAEESVAAGDRFLALLHWHNVHVPYIATDTFRALYPPAAFTSNEQDYFGAVSMMDAAVGKVRAFLRAKGVANHTALFLAADNGPEVGVAPAASYPTTNWPFFPNPGSTSGLFGRKRAPPARTIAAPPPPWARAAVAVAPVALAPVAFGTGRCRCSQARPHRGRRARARPHRVARPPRRRQPREPLRDVDGRLPAHQPVEARASLGREGSTWPPRPRRRAAPAYRPLPALRRSRAATQRALRGQGAATRPAPKSPTATRSTPGGPRSRRCSASRRRTPGRSTAPRCFPSSTARRRSGPRSSRWAGAAPCRMDGGGGRGPEAPPPDRAPPAPEAAPPRAPASLGASSGGRRRAPAGPSAGGAPRVPRALPCRARGLQDAPPSLGRLFKTRLGSTNAAEGFRGCPPNASLTQPAPPSAPHVPAQFAAMQAAWVEGGWKLLGCREAAAQPWRLFLFDLRASDSDDPARDDLLAANRPRAVQMAARLAAWMRSVEASQGPAETNCSAKWAGSGAVVEGRTGDQPF